MPRPVILRTTRLLLRPLTTADAGLILELFNDPDFLRNVGDRGIRTLADAKQYLLAGPIHTRETLGFGLWRVELATTGEPIGICGLLQRDYLPEPDIGFAFLESFRSRGYATEAAVAVLSHAREVLGIERILAITAPHNEVSMKILRRLGLELEGRIRPSDDGPECCLFATRRTGGA